MMLKFDSTLGHWSVIACNHLYYSSGISIADNINRIIRDDSNFMSPGYDNSTGILIVQIMTGSGINYHN